MQDELNQHVRALRRYALLLCRSAEEAEDLVQEALTRALAAASSFRPELDLRVWLFSILHNTHRSGRRRLRTALRALAHAPEPAAASEPGQVAYVELREVLEALKLLPEDQREAVVLVGVEGLSYAEAAAVLKTPVGTVMSRLSRGRRALRLLTDREEPPAASAPLKGVA